MKITTDLNENNTDYGAIVFNVGGEIPYEIIRFSSDGNIYVKGLLVVNDMEIIEGLREFIVLSRKNKEDGV